MVSRMKQHVLKCTKLKLDDSNDANKVPIDSAESASAGAATNVGSSAFSDPDTSPAGLTDGTPAQAGGQNPGLEDRGRHPFTRGVQRGGCKSRHAVKWCLLYAGTYIFFPVFLPVRGLSGAFRPCVWRTVSCGLVWGGESWEAVFCLTSLKNDFAREDYCAEHGFFLFSPFRRTL